MQCLGLGSLAGLSQVSPVLCWSRSPLLSSWGWLVPSLHWSQPVVPCLGSEPRRLLACAQGFHTERMSAICRVGGVAGGHGVLCPEAAVVLPAQHRAQAHGGADRLSRQGAEGWTAGAQADRLCHQEPGDPGYASPMGPGPGSSCPWALGAHAPIQQRVVPSGDRCAHSEITAKVWEALFLEQ